MVMLGINRIVVTDGSINAKVVFDMRAEDKAVFRRPERGHWIRHEARAGGTIAIAGRTIHVDDIYRRASA